MIMFDSNETWILSADFRKILKYQISWKFVQLEASYLWGRTDRRDETNSRFSQFCERA